MELPGERIKVHSLILKKPITIVGRPGTVIELTGGGIIIDFSLGKETGA